MPEAANDVAVLPTTEKKETPPREKEDREREARVKRARLLLPLAAILGIAFDAFCNHELIGIGFPLFVLALLAAAVFTGWQEKGQIDRRNVLMLGIPLAFFSVMVAVHANPFLTFWNTFGSLVFLLLLLYYRDAGDLLAIRFGAFLGIPWTVFGNSLWRPVPMVVAAAAPLAESGGSRRKALPWIRGIALAVPILAVFLALLASADDLFARLLSQIGNWFSLRDIDKLIPHVVIAFGAAWCIAGGLSYAACRGAKTAIPGTEKTAASPRSLLGFIETMIVLGSVVFVFAAFIGVQSSYFFGGIGYVRSLGLNYAAYAHRGFWELVIVAVLTLTLIQGLRTAGRRDTELEQRWFYIMGTLLVGFTLMLLASAMQRMHAYETVWGATPLRIYVDGFIIWLGIALCWFVVTLWRWSDRFTIGVIACGIGYLVSLNLIDPDASVARRNIAQYHRTGKLCMETVNKLSDDAIPVLCAAYDEMPAGRIRSELGWYLKVSQEMAERSPQYGMSCHLARASARAALTLRKDRLSRETDPYATVKYSPEPAHGEE